MSPSNLLRLPKKLDMDIARGFVLDSSRQYLDRIKPSFRDPYEEFLLQVREKVQAGFWVSIQVHKGSKFHYGIYL